MRWRGGTARCLVWVPFRDTRYTGFCPTFAALCRPKHSRQEPSFHKHRRTKTVCRFFATFPRPNGGSTLPPTTDRVLKLSTKPFLRYSRLRQHFQTGRFHFCSTRHPIAKYAGHQDPKATSVIHALIHRLESSAQGWTPAWPPLRGSMHNRTHDGCVRRSRVHKHR